ncbi:MAG: hypothetical protein ACI35V_07200 [Sphingobacterium composti]|uniref:hypothetical protein n=1 Tax=Sphingobacterium composti TaxID=363260 RepID=UPI00135AD4B4|nr:hypothetical protein [Sphingobacterium composti Ten et al. 2007 non Yoo et al. 2007]
MKKKHNGIRPQDLIILLKIIIIKNDSWFAIDIAQQLNLSASFVSESLDRSKFSGLLSEDKKRVNKQGLYELLIYGLKYIFPAKPQALVKGIATAYSYPEFNNEFSSTVACVWKCDDGDIIGQEIEPLYEKQTIAALNDSQLYKALALLDLLRIGNKREIAFAQKELKKIILD